MIYETLLYIIGDESLFWSQFLTLSLYIHMYSFIK